jgi:hypothetical protein
MFIVQALIKVKILYLIKFLLFIMRTKFLANWQHFFDFNYIVNFPHSFPVFLKFS